MKFAFLACETTLPNMPNRRVDAYEFDYQFDGLKSALDEYGHQLIAMDWKAPISSYLDVDGVVIGTPWNYQDNQNNFLDRLDEIEAANLKLFNSAKLVRWNINKTYLRDLEQLGASTIPTAWIDAPTKEDVDAILNAYDTAGVVMKRQVGAGAAGQKFFKRDEPIPDGVLLDRPAMLQPFIPSIQTEGEYSFIFIDGQFSHALLKSAKSGDYRIQSSYGGFETTVDPTPTDIEAAAKILSYIPDEIPLYARVDVVRGLDQALLLMEVEMIEPYLYPVEGPNMSQLYAQALIKRCKS